eukprot:7998-Heterococcus_DN1.PRE.1
MSTFLRMTAATRPAVVSLCSKPALGVAGLQVLNKRHMSQATLKSLGIDKATGITKPVRAAADLPTCLPRVAAIAPPLLPLLDPQKVLRNLPYAEIFDREVEQKEGVVTKNGTFCVSTGKFTGRSPKDKYFVKQVTPALHQFFLAAHSCTNTVFQSALGNVLLQLARVQPPSEKNLDWGNVNVGITPQVYKDIYKLAVDHYNKNVKEAYVFDGFCGTNPKSRKNVRIITELAWQHHFVTN